MFLFFLSAGIFLIFILIWGFPEEAMMFFEQVVLLNAFCGRSFASFGHMIIIERSKLLRYQVLMAASDRILNWCSSVFLTLMMCSSASLSYLSRWLVRQDWPLLLVDSVSPASVLLTYLLSSVGWLWYFFFMALYLLMKTTSGTTSSISA